MLSTDDGSIVADCRVSPLSLARGVWCCCALVMCVCERSGGPVECKTEMRRNMCRFDQLLVNLV